MNTTKQIPATQNEAWGFWGTMNEHASAAWPLAMIAISDATSQPLESVRIFLDSRHGRHFADDVQNGLGAKASPCRMRSTPPPNVDGLDDWPPDQQAVRHPARPALPDRLCDPLRNQRRDGRLMKTLATEREQALRWLIANRRPDISIEQAVRVMCAALPRDLTTIQLLRRIAEEEEAKLPSRQISWRRTPPGLPPRG
jgi:hypothetical protein